MVPYVGAGFAFIYFIGFAVMTPLSSKLYKETFYALGMGMATAGLYPLYYRRLYLQTIDSIYV